MFLFFSYTWIYIYENNSVVNRRGVGVVSAVDGETLFFANEDDSMDAVSSSTGIVMDGVVVASAATGTADDAFSGVVVFPSFGPSNTNMIVLLRGSTIWDSFVVNAVLLLAVPACPNTLYPSM